MSERRTAVAFCGWGYGFDVGVNIIADGRYVGGLDLTSIEARNLAYQLMAAAHFAEEQETLCREMDEWAEKNNGRDANWSR